MEIRGCNIHTKKLPIGEDEGLAALATANQSLENGNSAVKTTSNGAVPS